MYLAGALYVSDDFVTIRRIDLASKSVTTFAGKASSSGGSADGIAAAASFNSSQGFSTDGQGTLYAADQADPGVLPIGGSTVLKIVALERTSRRDGRRARAVAHLGAADLERDPTAC